VFPTKGLGVGPGGRGILECESSFLKYRYTRYAMTTEVKERRLKSAMIMGETGQSWFKQTTIGTYIWFVLSLTCFCTCQLWNKVTRIQRRFRSQGDVKTEVTHTGRVRPLETWPLVDYILNPTLTHQTLGTSEETKKGIETNGIL